MLESENDCVEDAASVGLLEPSNSSRILNKKENDVAKNIQKAETLEPYVISDEEIQTAFDFFFGPVGRRRPSCRYPLSL